MSANLHRLTFRLALVSICLGVVVVYGSYFVRTGSAAPHTSVNPQAESEYQQAINYILGNGVAQDKNKAIELTMQSATHGYAAAQFMLGEFYYRGELLQDYRKAYLWFSLAAANGHPRAPAFRYEVGAFLSPAELLAAQKEAESYRNK